MTNYLYVLRYSNLDLNCINKAFLCTYGQFVKEYSNIYNEIDYTVNKISYVDTR